MASTTMDHGEQQYLVRKQLPGEPILMSSIFEYNSLGNQLLMSSVFEFKAYFLPIHLPQIVSPTSSLSPRMLTQNFMSPNGLTLRMLARSNLRNNNRRRGGRGVILGILCKRNTGQRPSQHREICLDLTISRKADPSHLSSARPREGDRKAGQQRNASRHMCRHSQDILQEQYRHRFGKWGATQGRGTHNTSRNLSNWKSGEDGKIEIEKQQPNRELHL